MVLLGWLAICEPVHDGEAIKIVALRTDSMLAKARKGFKNGKTSRSSLIIMLTRKNIIKPCFL
jgi:hypothetical protein